MCSQTFSTWVIWVISSLKISSIYVDIISLYITRVSPLFSKNPLIKLTPQKIYLNTLPFNFFFPSWALICFSVFSLFCFVFLFLFLHTWLYIRLPSMPRLLGFWISPKYHFGSAIYPKKSTLGTIYQRKPCRNLTIKPKSL